MSSVVRSSDIVPGNYRLDRVLRRNLPVHPILHRAGVFVIPGISGKNAQKYPATQLFYYTPYGGTNQINSMLYRLCFKEVDRPAGAIAGPPAKPEFPLATIIILW
jgi:hypothetical protein